MISPVARQILSCTARSAVFRPSSVVAAVPRRFVSNKTLDPILYEAVGTSTGSRADGHAATNAGNLSVKMQMPKEVSFDPSRRVMIMNTAGARLPLDHG